MVYCVFVGYIKIMLIYLGKVVEGYCLVYLRILIYWKYSIFIVKRYGYRFIKSSCLCFDFIKD